MSYIGNPILSTDFPLDVFSGNGSTTAFTMQIAPASVNSIIVVVSGVTQAPATYTISGTTLNFTAAPPSGTGNIVVRYLGVKGIPSTPSAASVVQSSLAAGVAGTGPAFGAYAVATTSLPHATYTKLTLDTEEFDTNNNFTSSRFTPTVAGYYQINGGFATIAGAGLMLAVIYKNGTAFKVGNQVSASSAGIQSCVNSIVYLNGSTDYVELYVFQSSGSTVTTVGGVGVYNYFNGAMVRAA